MKVRLLFLTHAWVIVLGVVALTLHPNDPGAVAGTAARVSPQALGLSVAPISDDERSIMLEQRRLIAERASRAATRRAYLASHPRPHPHIVSPAVTSSPRVSSGSPKAYALSLVGPEQFSCLEPMWERESGWNPEDRNPSSGAYGIAQFLPSTWADLGLVETSDPLAQIRAGLLYIKQRYGTPCGAWGFWQAHQWY